MCNALALCWCLVLWWQFKSISNSGDTLQSNLKMDELQLGEFRLEDMEEGKITEFICGSE